MSSDVRAGRRAPKRGYGRGRRRGSRGERPSLTDTDGIGIRGSAFGSRNSSSTEPPRRRPRLSGAATDTATGNRVDVTASGTGGTIHFGGVSVIASTSDGTLDSWDGAGGSVTDDRNAVTLKWRRRPRAGNTATLQGTGARPSIAAASVNVFDGASGTIVGDYDTLSIYAEASEAASGDVTTILDKGVSLTISRAGSIVNVASTGESVAVGGGQVNLWDGVEATVTGDGNSVTLDDDVNATISETGDTATIQGTGNSLITNSTRVGVTDGSSATISGSCDTLTLFGGASRPGRNSVPWSLPPTRLGRRSR